MISWPYPNCHTLICVHTTQAYTHLHTYTHTQHTQHTHTTHTHNTHTTHTHNTHTHMHTLKSLGIYSASYATIITILTAIQYY